MPNKKPYSELIQQIEIDAEELGIRPELIKEFTGYIIMGRPVPAVRMLRRVAVDSGEDYSTGDLIKLVKTLLEPLNTLPTSGRLD